MAAAAAAEAEAEAEGRLKAPRALALATVRARVGRAQLTLSHAQNERTLRARLFPLVARHKGAAGACARSGGALL